MSRKTTQTQAIDHHIGQQIRFYRIQRHLSQEELAMRLGISYQQLHKYETGANSASASRLAEIAKALGVTVNELFDHLAQLQPHAHWVTENPSREQLLLAKYFNQIANAHDRRAVSAMIHALANEPFEERRPLIHPAQATA